MKTTPSAEAHNNPTDAEILSQIRPLLELTRQRDQFSNVVESLRFSEDTTEIALRDEAGEKLAALDEKICECSVTVFDQIGLWHAAGMISAALDYTAAFGEIDAPPRAMADVQAGS